MEKDSYMILVFVGIILMFLSLLMSLPLGLGLLIFSLSLLLVSVFNMLGSSNIIKLVSDLFLLAGVLSLVPFFSSIAEISINLLIINRISVYIIIFAIALLAIYYLYTIIKEILSSIEVRLQK